MKPYSGVAIAALMIGAIACRAQQPAGVPLTEPAQDIPRIFQSRGVVKELRPAERTAVIQHEAISNYMDAMTMPFSVKDTNQLEGLRPGDEVSFRLLVTGDDSWIDRVAKTGRALPEAAKPVQQSSGTQTATAGHPLLSYKFTNEFGQPVSFNDFKGQAIAYSFFFTRCPIPQYCPRLSKNFQEASQKLSAMMNAPTNWHFISVSFDTEFDTPAVLRAYAQLYQYDSNHWTFLTGPADKIAELARLSGVDYQRDGSLFNHNFRTLVVDREGRLQTSYPMGGDLSDALVADILKAATASPR